MTERIDRALTDAQAMRNADRDLLSLALMHGRNRTLAWLTLMERLPGACRLAGRNLSQTEWDTFLPNSGEIGAACEQWRMTSSIGSPSLVVQTA